MPPPFPTRLSSFLFGGNWVHIVTTHWRVTCPHTPRVHCNDPIAGASQLRHHVAPCIPALWPARDQQNGRALSSLHVVTINVTNQSARMAKSLPKIGTRHEIRADMLGLFLMNTQNYTLNWTQSFPNQV